MSVYTEADFAGCLIECGPHMTGTLVEGPYMQPHTLYREHVFNYWCVLFPQYLKGEGHFADWQLFWGEYLDWVGR